MRCFTRRTAPTPCRSSMRGSSAAAYRSGAGSSRLPISRNAGQWRARHTPRVSSRFRRNCSTPRSSFCAGPWPSTPSSPIATIAVAESQPIAFDGDAWRGYVPLRLPWTLCIRDRAPPGSAAVLINRAHTYPDLALPIDEAEYRIFAAIDGSRCIDEILPTAAAAGGKEHARRLFERLWHYDQIVLDASGVSR